MKVNTYHRTHGYCTSEVGSRMQCADDLSDVFECLAHPHRRDLLMELHHGSPPISLPNQSASSMMYHLHVPKLAQSGLVDWNRERDTVHRGAEFERVSPFLDVVSELEQWPVNNSL